MGTEPEWASKGNALMLFEAQAERGWDPRVLDELASAFSRSLHIQTPGQALQFSLSELRMLPPGEDWKLVRIELTRLSADGKFVVFLGGPSPASNVFFHLMGARHLNVSRSNLFAIPLKTFIRFAEKLRQHGERSSKADTGIDKISGDTTRRIGDIETGS